MKSLMTLLVLTLLFVSMTFANNNCSNYNCWNYHADGICLEWTTPKNTYNGSLSTQMRITCDETVRDLSISFMLMSSKNGDQWSQVYVVTESPTLHTLTTEFHAELSFPPNLSVGGSTTTTYAFSELQAGTVRDGIIDINLKNIDSGSLWALISARWKVNRGWWFLQNWQEKQIPYQYSLTLATYVADLQVMLKELQQNYAALQQDFNTIQNSYSSLQKSFSMLQYNFNNLQGNYSTLQATYSTLQANYQALQSKYNVLEDNFNVLESSYNTQTSAYGNITKEFDAVKASREALSTQFTFLQNQYDSLQTDYRALQNQYIQSCDSRVQQLTILAIVAIIVIVASVITTAIIWRHKKKQ